MLVDPDLRWPSGLAAGDPLRPPRASNLSPLLNHWGVVLEKADDTGEATRLYRPQAAGRLIAHTDECRNAGGALLAVCGIGKGRAIILADADLLHERQWAGVGRTGAWDGMGKSLRSADTPLFIAGLLDDLLGRRAVAAQRWQVDGIAWVDSRISRLWIFAMFMVFPLLVAGFGLIALKRSITHRLIHSLDG